MFNPVRRALFVLAICSFGLGTGEYAVLGVLPEIATDLQVSVSQAGHLVSAYALGVVIGAPVLAAVSVRFPRKGLLIALVIGLALGNVLSALMTDFYGLVAMRFLAGLPHGAFFGLASVQAAQLVPAGQRSQAMAIVFAGLTVSNVVGVPLTTFVGQNTSWSVVFLLVAAVEVIGVLGMLAAVPRSPRNPDEAPSLVTELRVFKNEQIWLALGVAMIGCGAIFATFSYIAPMMTEVAGYAESSITPLLVLFGLGMTFGNLIGARLSDRYDVTKVIYCVMAAQVLVAAVFYFASSNKIAAAVMIFLFPFCNTMAFPALQNRIISMAGGAPNLAAASMHAAFNIANSLGAWLGGLTIAAGWGYNSPNLVAVGLGLIAAVVAVYASEISPSLVRRSRPNLYTVPPPSNGPRSRSVQVADEDSPRQTALQRALDRARHRTIPAAPATSLAIGPVVVSPATDPVLLTSLASALDDESPAWGPQHAETHRRPTNQPSVVDPGTDPVLLSSLVSALGADETGPHRHQPAVVDPGTDPVLLSSLVSALGADETGPHRHQPAVVDPGADPVLLGNLTSALSAGTAAPAWGPQHGETGPQKIRRTEVWPRGPR